MAGKVSFAKYKSSRIDIAEDHAAQLANVLEDIHSSEFPLFIGSIRLPYEPAATHCRVEGIRNFSTGEAIDYPYDCPGVISAVFFQRPKDVQESEKVIFTVGLGNAFTSNKPGNLLKVKGYVLVRDLLSDDFEITKKDSEILNKLVHIFPVLSTIGTINQCKELVGQIAELTEETSRYSTQIEGLEKLSSIFQEQGLVEKQYQQASKINDLLEKLENDPLPPLDNIRVIAGLLDRLSENQLPSSSEISAISDVLTRWHDESAQLPSNEKIEEQIKLWEKLEGDASKAIATISDARDQLIGLRHDFSDAFPALGDLVVPSDKRTLSIDELETIKRRLYYTYSDAKIKAFLSALNTTQIIVLCGKPGTGKSTFAEEMAQAIGASYHKIEVQNNWTDRSDLLGYYNPTNSTYYSTEFLESLMAARDDLKTNGDNAHLHIICLDEMNLARVEYYFASFLSLLPGLDDGERRGEKSPKRWISLLPASADPSVINGKSEKELNEQKNNARYMRFEFPRNVRFVGTMNMDDTAQFLSPKVIDRSLFIEFDEKDAVGKNPDFSFNESDDLYFPCAEFGVKSENSKELDDCIATVCQFGEVSGRLRSYAKKMWPVFCALSEGDISNTFTDTILLTKILPAKESKIKDGNGKELEIPAEYKQSSERYKEGIKRGKAHHSYDVDSWSFWE